MRTPRRQLLVPAALTVAVIAAAAGCTSSNPADAGDAETQESAVDVAENDAADACNPVHEDDGAVRYTVCPSDAPGCARVVHPDGAVEDPTFC